MYDSRAKCQYIPFSILVLVCHQPVLQEISGNNRKKELVFVICYYR